MCQVLTHDTSNPVDPVNAKFGQLCWLWTITTDQNLPTTQHHSPVWHTHVTSSHSDCLIYMVHDVLFKCVHYWLWSSVLTDVHNNLMAFIYCGFMEAITVLTAISWAWRHDNNITSDDHEILHNCHKILYTRFRQQLEVRGEIIRTVLFWIVYWSCAQS